MIALPSNFNFCRCIDHMMKWEISNIVCDLDLGIKVKGQIMYFLVNASPPKLLDVATSNFAGP